MKSNNRIARINEEIQKELSEIIRADIKDPRLSIMTTVVAVETTPDLKYCKILISVLGDDEQKKSTIEALKNAGGFIRKELATRINLRNTPELTFKLDESVEYAIKMSKLIDKVNKKDGE